jgi:hypothetical protein
MNQPINDISQCLVQAQQLTSSLQNTRRKEQRLVRAFTALAGDATVGLVAFMIWRSRSVLLTR